MTASKVPAPTVIDERMRYSFAEACAILRYSPATGYKEIKAGTLKVFKEGRRIYVTGAELIRRALPPKKPMVTGPLLRAVEAASETSVKS